MSKFHDFSVELPDDVVRELSGKKAIVTGGSGMIGREVVRLLLDAGCFVKSVSLDNLQPDSRATYIKGDLANFEFCQEITSGIDYVFHVAGIKGSVVVTQEKPASFFVPLLMMNTNIIEAARINGAQKLVYTSSIGAYAPSEVFSENKDDLLKAPMDMYPGWAKRIAEMQIMAYKIQYGMNNFSIVRPSNIYGPGDNFDEVNAMVIPSLIARIARGDDPVMIWGDGSSERDFLYSSDAAVGIILACIRGTDSKPVNLGCGYGISIAELVQTMHQITDFKEFFDVSKPAGFPRRIMNLDLASKLIGFKPQVELVDGLRATWNWYIRYSDEHLNKKNYFR
jgi:GDP-L-fucose synthase